uniref:Reverse transcriptase domain-containing protein n=1 Tax=Bursaphelenchus xylophilus TaxID=6326 RepID=A0A1I7SG89_BURXY
MISRSQADRPVEGQPVTAMSFHNLEPNNLYPENLRPTGSQDANRGVADIAEEVTGPSGLVTNEEAARAPPLFVEGEYKRAHCGGGKCHYCRVLWIGARSSKARTDSWNLCEILFLINKCMELGNVRRIYSPLESSLKEAGINRTRHAIVKCRLAVMRDRFVDNAPYSEHWRLYNACAENRAVVVPMDSATTVKKRTARQAGLESPSQIGVAGKRVHEAETGTDRINAVIETNTTPLEDIDLSPETPEGLAELPSTVEIMELTEDGSRSRGTANDADGGVSISDPLRNRPSSSQESRNVPEQVDPDGELVWESLYGAQLRGAMRTTDRPRLPKLTKFSAAEQLWIKSKVEKARLECVSYGIEQQWLRASAVLYATIKTVAACRPYNKAREAHKVWLENKRAEEKRVRRIIGRIETVRTMPKGKRTDKQIRLARKINRLKRVSFPEMDWHGFLNHFKAKLDLLKKLISVRVAEHERKISRKIAGTYGKSVSGQSGFTPDVVAATTFWSGLAQPGPKKFKKNSLIFQTWKDSVVENMNTEPVLLHPLIIECMNKPSPFKATGPDGIFNSYWRQGFIANWVKSLIQRTIQTGEFPASLMCGRTVLLYKNGDTAKPENYRPITCLNGCFKMTNAVITKVIVQRVQDTCALPGEQMALKPKVWACMEAQLRDQALQSEIGNDCKTAWIDFSKAYDSLDHDAIRFVIETLALPDGMEKYLLKSLESWKTKLVLSNRGKVATGRPYKIKRGVLQGDSLSPALFVIATSPIVSHLKRVCPSGRIQLYMDDIKLYGKSETELRMLIKEVQKVANKLGLQMNLKKCSTYGAGLTESIAGFDPLGDRAYKYLGVPQRSVADTNLAFGELEGKVIRSIEETMACEYLTMRQVVTRLNSVIGPLVRFVAQSVLTSQAKVSWIYNKISDLDSKIRAKLAQTGLRYKKSNVARLYLSKSKNGIGLVNVQQVLVEALVSRAIYCLRAPSLVEIREHILTAEFDPVGAARTVLRRSRIQLEIERVEMASAISAIKTNYQARWMTKFTQSKLYQKWVHHDIDLANSNLWLERGEISPQNARIAVAAQDNTLLCRGFVGNRESEKQCRMCNMGIETCSHILTECSYHRAHMYIERHDSVARNIYAVLAKDHGLWIPHYSQPVSSVTKTPTCELYWNYKFPCTRALEACRPDIVLIDRAKRTILIVEVAVSYVTRLKQMVSRKVYKYGVNGEKGADGESRGWNMIRELSEVYNMKVNLCAVVIGASGEVLPCTVKAIQSISSKTSSRQLLERCQRSAVLGSTRVVKRHLAEFH